MLVRFLDLSVSDPLLKKDLLNAVDNVLRHGRIILGPEVQALEEKFATYCTRRFAVGVSSGTDALYLALRALDIGPGDEVITTPLSWIATVNAIVMVGATPVFADIKRDLNIDPDRIAEAVTPRTRAIVPVHYTGKMCDMNRICEIADTRNLVIVEDAAQAFGAYLNNGRKAGSLGRIACFSMNSMKVLHSYGEAGAVLTDDEKLRDRIISLCYNGVINREDCIEPSLNFKIQTLQAALLLVEFNRFERIVARRREIAGLYDEALNDLVECPAEAPGSRHVYYTYTIQVDRRDELREFLTHKGIETKIHHPILMPYHTAYKNRFKLDIPVADKVHKRILSIPNHEKIISTEINYVIASIRTFYGA